MVYGVRVLVTLKSGVEIDKSSGDGTKNSPYKLVQKWDNSTKASGNHLLFGYLYSKI